MKIAWSRHELKAIFWDLQRDKPSPMLTGDFERIARIQKQGTPWIISLWRLPERFYVDPNQRPMGTFGRQITGERWPEFLDLIGSYLLHLKTHYGAEPDLFSFNEPDLGVSIGLTPEGQREAVKRIGAHLRKLGLKTKMLLGDTANPRDSTGTCSRRRPTPRRCSTSARFRFTVGAAARRRSTRPGRMSRRGSACR